MKKLKEAEIAMLYEGKLYNRQNLRKIAMGSGNTRAVISNRRITKSQGSLIGITEEIYEDWWRENCSFSVFVDLDEESNTIKRCGIFKEKVTKTVNGSLQYSRLTPTQEEIEILRRVMDYITI